MTVPTAIQVVFIFTISFGLSFGWQQKSTNTRKQLRLLEERVVLGHNAFQDQLDSLSAHMNVCCSLNYDQVDTLQQPNSSNDNEQWSEDQDKFSVFERKIDFNIKHVKQGFQEEKAMLRQTTNSFKNEINQAIFYLESAGDSLTAIANKTLIEMQTNQGVVEMSLLQSSKLFEENILHNISEFKANVSRMLSDNVQKMEETTATMLLNLDTLFNATNDIKEKVNKDLENIVSVRRGDIMQPDTSNKEAIQTQERLIKVLFKGILEGSSILYELPSISCENGWIHFKMSCYWIQKENKLNWTDAVEACPDNSYLVEIDSADEDAFIRRQIGRHTLAFIGLSDIIQEGNWMWQNSQRIGNYRNWDRQEPNNQDNNEHCVELHSSNGKWNDVPCSRKYMFICEKEIILDLEALSHALV